MYGMRWELVLCKVYYRPGPIRYRKHVGFISRMFATKPIHQLQSGTVKSFSKARIKQPHISDVSITQKRRVEQAAPLQRLRYRLALRSTYRVYTAYTKFKKGEVFSFLFQNAFNSTQITIMIASQCVTTVQHLRPRSSVLPKARDKETLEGFSAVTSSTLKS